MSWARDGGFRGSGVRRRAVWNVGVAFDAARLRVRGCHAGLVAVAVRMCGAVPGYHLELGRAIRRRCGGTSVHPRKRRVERPRIVCFVSSGSSSKRWRHRFGSYGASSGVASMQGWWSDEGTNNPRAGLRALSLQKKCSRAVATPQERVGQSYVDPIHSFSSEGRARASARVGLHPELGFAPARTTRPTGIVVRHSR